MDELFRDFAEAHSGRNGYLLAQTLSPVHPPDHPQRLRHVWESTSALKAHKDVKQSLCASLTHRNALSKDEVNGWVDVYVAYWKALGQITAGESGKVSQGRVRLHASVRPLTFTSLHGRKSTRLGGN
jgi:COP9 signalosome complex subunit 12